MWIYILLSIKTRIETHIQTKITSRHTLFISYYPLKQGLKPNSTILPKLERTLFISYYPLKQGLKRIEALSDCVSAKNLYPTIH